MTSRGIHTAPTRSENGIFKARYLVIGFFLFVFAHAGIQLSFNGPTSSISEILGIAEYHKPLNVSYQPIHNIPHPGTTLPVAELLKGNELQEKPPLYKVYNFYLGIDLIKSACIGTGISVHQGFLRSLQNRPSLSLFILHHSWKSYLS